MADCDLVLVYPLMAEWQSGHAAACKAVDAGSIPTSASSPLSKAKYFPMPVMRRSVPKIDLIKHTGRLGGARLHLETDFLGKLIG